VTRPPPTLHLAASALALAAIVCAACGDGGAKDTSTAPAPMRTRAATHRVLFLGLDGADWSYLDPLIARGAMPELARLVREGRRGILRTAQPPLSPLLWTTMMTGVGPLEHGILDFTRFNPRTGQREPIRSEDRRVPALWTIASAAKRKVGVFGMWATHPAEPTSGVVVSDRLFSFQHLQQGPPKGFVAPAEQAPWALAALRSMEQAVDCATLREYVPAASDTDCESALLAPDPYSRPLAALRRILVETRVYHALASEWIAREQPDLAIVYFQGTDAIGHIFAAYAPPRLPSISEEDFARYGEVPERYFQSVDRLIGEYRALAERLGATLMLASDHGFAWSDGRPDSLSSFAVATAGKWHREEGMYLVWGPHVSAGRGDDGRIDQVAATVLALLDLPAGGGHAGPPLAGLAPSSRASVDYTMLPRSTAPAPAGAGDAAGDLAKLTALGYLGTGESARAPRAAIGSTRTPGSYNNEGLILESLGRPDDAIGAYERALRLEPRLASASWNLSHLLFERGAEARRSDALLLDALGHGLPDGAQQVVRRAIAVKRAGDSARARRLLDGAVRVLDGDAELWLFRGRYRVEAEDCRGALADFARAASLAPERAAVWAASGVARLCLGDRAGARRDLERSLGLDPNQPEVERFLADLG
jgi:Flp pilus assembly protein TadD